MVSFCLYIFACVIIWYYDLNMCGPLKCLLTFKFLLRLCHILLAHIRGLFHLFLKPQCSYQQSTSYLCTLTVSCPTHLKIISSPPKTLLKLVSLTWEVAGSNHPANLFFPCNQKWLWQSLDFCIIQLQSGSSQTCQSLSASLSPAISWVSLCSFSWLDWRDGRPRSVPISSWQKAMYEQPKRMVLHDPSKVAPFKGWKITMPISQVSVGIGKPELPKWLGLGKKLSNTWSFDVHCEYFCMVMGTKRLPMASERLGSGPWIITFAKKKGSVEHSLLMAPSTSEKHIAIKGRILLPWCRKECQVSKINKKLSQIYVGSWQNETKINLWPWNCG